MRSLPLFTLLFLLCSVPVVASEGPCPELKGDFMPGGLVWGRVEPGSQLRLSQIDVTVLSDGSFVLGLGRDATTQDDLVMNERQTCKFELATREYRISRVEGVPQRTVTPPEAQLARIRKERKLVSTAKARRIENEGFLKAVLSGLSWPATGRISGVYGSQRFYNGTPGNPHYGVDVGGPTGIPVHAPGPGLVTLAEPDLFYSCGTIILDHGYGLSSSFLHMSRIDVRVGDVLEAGDVMGAIGATGRATGPHLDWRMSWFNQRVDPQLLVPPMP